MTALSHREKYERCCEAARVLLNHGWPVSKVLDVPLGLSRRTIYNLARKSRDHRDEIHEQAQHARQLMTALESHRA